MAFRSSTGLTPGSGNSVVINVPAGATSGDIAVVGIYKENDRAITPPTGFTEKVALTTSATARGSLYVFWKRLTAADTGTYTFSWGAGGVWRSAACALFSGRVASGDPFDGTVGTAESTTAVTTLNVSTSPANADGDAIDFHTNFQGGNSYTAPTNYTERQDLDVIGMFTRDAVASGSTGNVTATSNVSGFQKAFLGVLQVAGGTTVNGTGQGAFTFGSTAAGVPTTPGTAAAALTFAGAASGTPETFGTATGAYSFTGAASGSTQTTVTGTGLGAFSFGATATGTPETFGTAAATLSFTGAATGVPDVQGAGSAAVTFTGTAAGTPDVQGQAAGAFTFTGAASGQVEGAVSGTGLGEFTFTATAAGTPDVHGTAAAALTFDAAATGVRDRQGQAVATLTFTGAALGAPVLSGQAAAAFTFTGVAAGNIPGQFPDPYPMGLAYNRATGLVYNQAGALAFQEAT